MKTLVTTMLLVLAGCAANPPREPAHSIEEFVSDVSSRELRLSTMPSADAATDASMLSAEHDPVYGYAGLKQVYAPAQQHCEARGGSLQIVEHKAFSQTAPVLPARFQCRAEDQLLWAFSVQYSVHGDSDDTPNRVLRLLPHARLARPTEEEPRRANRKLIPKAEARGKEKESVAQKNAGAKKSASRQPPKTSRGEALAVFRKNLKAGDRVQWKTGDVSAKSAGTIVRLDGDLALVQFDNAASSGNSVRYFNRLQLEPFDTPASLRAAR